MTAADDHEVTPAPDAIGRLRAQLDWVATRSSAATGLMVDVADLVAAFDALAAADAAGYRRGRTEVAEVIRAFGLACEDRAARYASELSVCARRANDAVVGAYMEAARIAEGLTQDATPTQPYKPQSDVEAVPPASPTVETPEAVGGAERVWALPEIPEDVMWIKGANGWIWRRYGLRRDWWTCPDAVDNLDTADLLRRHGPLTEAPRV